jgi:hypothetical protein
MAFKNAQIASTTGSTGVTSLVVNAPTNASGDIIMICGYFSGSVSAPTITWPSGFSATVVSCGDTSPFYAGNCWMALAWKQSGGSEPGTYTVTTTLVNTIDLISSSFSGRSGTQFTATQPTAGAAAHGASSMSLPLTGVTAAAGDDVAAFFLATNIGWSVTSNPSGYTTEATTSGAVADEGTMALLVNANVSAGATGTLTATMTAGTVDADGMGLVVSLAQAMSGATVAWLK